jgi:hypothetical protein
MDVNSIESRAVIAEFDQQLSALRQFSENYAVPSVLEMVGKLGAINRCAISLVEACVRDSERLEQQALSGDSSAQEESQRLMLELRDMNERVMVGLNDLENDTAVLSESLRITTEVVGYLKRMRELLSAQLWNQH